MRGGPQNPRFMSSIRETAYRLRHLLLVAAALCMAVGIWMLFGMWPLDRDEDVTGFIGTPFTLPGVEYDDSLSIYGVNAAFLGVLLGTQRMFLRPRRGRRPRLLDAGRPMGSAILAAAFVAMLLSIGLLATLLELPDLWPNVGKDSMSLIWVTMLVLWVAWSAVFFVYWKGGRTQLGRILRGLMCGSLLEGFVATGVYVWNPHNEDCYCARGSYTGLVFGATVFGIFGMLALRAKLQRCLPKVTMSMECVASENHERAFGDQVAS